MPHSGGGGSHSGGSHHSSSHSHSSSGRSNARPRMSRTYFAGSKKYVYYYNNEPRYYYADRPYRFSNDQAGGFFSIIFGLIWTLFSAFFGVMFFTYDGGPLPLHYDTSIVIDDEIGIIEDRASLENSILKFQDETGVTISVVTRPTYNEYTDMGYDVEDESYYCYVTRFTDESHWLIYYRGNEIDRSDDWQWNLMCGDDCLRVLSRSQEDKFTDEFHKRLNNPDRYSFEDCVIDTLNLLKPSIEPHLVYRDGVNVNGVESGGQQASLLFVGFILIFVVIGMIVLVSGIIQIFKKKSPEDIAMANGIEIDPNQYIDTKNCIYCGGVYLPGTVKKCPHCGAGFEW